MATSGTTAFDLSIDDIVEEAYERCGLSTNSGYDLRSGDTLIRRNVHSVHYSMETIFFVICYLFILGFLYASCLHS